MKENIYGVRTILEAIKAQKSIDKVWIIKNSKNGSIQEMELKLKKLNISISHVPIKWFNKFKSKNHQGVVASISPIEFDDLELIIENNLNNSIPPVYLILDNITDVRNLGAIIRSASATGVTNIILPRNGSAPINSDTIKTSAGALFSTSISKVNHVKDALYLMSSNNIQTIAITEKSDKLIFNLNLKTPIALVLGSEEKGLSKGIMEMCDSKGRLPMVGEINSLNVSVACGTVLYEVIRQRNY
tara:strand:+ start:148 stop:879 length:732 start_codon:yes stop_codon:yes gene_type:complete